MPRPRNQSAWCSDDLSRAAITISGSSDVKLWAIMRALKWLCITVVLLSVDANTQSQSKRTLLPGCTSDVRTGVCNAKCSVKHVSGCTLEQVKPLLNIWHANCISEGFPDHTKEKIPECQAELDKKLQEWKDAHK
jgi:hypothetical protein